MTRRTKQELDPDMADEIATGTGWLLPLTDQLSVAVGEMEMIYVFPFEPDTFRVPISPKYARDVLIWQKLVVPIIDLANYLAVLGHCNSPAGTPASPASSSDDGKIPELTSQANHIVALFAYHEANGYEQHLAMGALILNDVPERIVVTDDHACSLPEPTQSWRSLARSCFLHDQFGSIPILDLAAVFGNAGKPESIQTHASDAVREQG